jgi:hypothetical protein
VRNEALGKDFISTSAISSAENKALMLSSGKNFIVREQFVVGGKLSCVPKN